MDWTCALPRKLSNTEGLPDAAADVGHRGAAVDHDDAPGLGLRQREIAIADAFVECGAFLVNTRLVGAGAFIAAPGACEACLCIDVDEDRDVGPEAATGDAVEIAHDFGVESAPAALIDQGGIGEAVAEHGAAGFERGPDHFVDILGAAGKVEQELGARPDVGAGGVEQNLPDLFPDRRAAGFHGLYHVVAPLPHPLREVAELCGFAAAVDAFKSDEASAGHSGILWWHMAAGFTAASGRG